MNRPNCELKSHKHEDISSLGTHTSRSSSRGFSLLLHARFTYPDCRRQASVSFCYSQANPSAKFVPHVGHDVKRLILCRLRIAVVCMHEGTLSNAIQLSASEGFRDNIIMLHLLYYGKKRSHHNVFVRGSYREPRLRPALEALGLRRHLASPKNMESLSTPAMSQMLSVNERRPRVHLIGHAKDVSYLIQRQRGRSHSANNAGKFLHPKTSLSRK